MITRIASKSRDEKSIQTFRLLFLNQRTSPPKSKSKKSFGLLCAMFCKVERCGVNCCVMFSKVEMRNVSRVSQDPLYTKYKAERQNVRELGIKI